MTHRIEIASYSLSLGVVRGRGRGRGSDFFDMYVVFGEERSEKGWVSYQYLPEYYIGHSKGEGRSLLP